MRAWHGATLLAATAGMDVLARLRPVARQSRSGRLLVGQANARVAAAKVAPRRKLRLRAATAA